MKEKNEVYYVYILKCSDGTLYTGITNNIENRMKAHSAGKGSKYVRTRLPFELIYKEEYKDKSSAMKREFKIKKLTRKEKFVLLKIFATIFE